MDDTQTTAAPPREESVLYKVTPRAGTRAQLFAAAIVWLVGASILLVRGVGYLHDESWWSLLIGVAVVLGVLKSRLLLDRVARKAVARIHGRGRACFFGFFSWKAWGFVAVMMGGGILLRGSGLPDWILAIVYLGVGTALAIAERIFWRAALTGAPAAAVEGQP